MLMMQTYITGVLDTQVGLFTKESYDFSLQVIIFGCVIQETDDFSLQFHDDLGYVQSSHPPICVPV